MTAMMMLRRRPPIRMKKMPATLDNFNEEAASCCGVES